MSIDTIGNFLTIIRNGIATAKPYVFVPYSQLKQQVAAILLEEGFIRDVLVEGEDVSSRRLKIMLKYVDGESVIHEICRKSTPGLRLYRGSQDIQPVIGGLGVSILTTNKGIMTNKRAKALNVGGEVICTVW